MLSSLLTSSTCSPCTSFDKTQVRVCTDDTDAGAKESTDNTNLTITMDPMYCIHVY